MQEKPNKNKFAKPIMFSDILLRKTDFYAFITQKNRSEVVEEALNDLFEKNEEIMKKIHSIGV